MFKKFGPWFILAGIMLLAVTFTICHGIKNDIEEAERNKAIEEALERTQERP